MCRAGVLAPVRRDAYRTRSAQEPAGPEARPALLVKATAPQLRPGRVVSHESAAVLLGRTCGTGPSTACRSRATDGAVAG